MFFVRRFDCFPLSKGDDTFWFGSKTVGMDESLWLFSLQEFLSCSFQNRISYEISTRSDADLRRPLFAFDIFRRQELEKIDKSCKVVHGGVEKSEIENSMRNGHVEVYGYAFWVNQCTSGFHGVNEPGGVRVTREDDRGATKGREDVREVFQQCGSEAKRKLSRCGRNQMGNEPILALPGRATEFDFEAKYHLRKANVDVVTVVSRKKE
ncbi:hypothetical protein Tco_1125272 [Tanacetum coccineum]|uniref:Uncharacterized protein n=1 Tax=Tanacetum coccineum TaxID=301880 RepID=A0ABQ5J8I9_9ASTR